MMLAVVSHDAGGAEILSSYVRQQGLHPLFVIEGPARRIFERKLGAIEVMPTEQAIQCAATILCGTSWQSDLEFNAIKMAREFSKRSVAFLDHWVNYAERFVRSSVTSHPDEIWVGDSIAETMVRMQFPRLPVRLVDNPYFKDIRAEIAATANRRPPNPPSLSVLYVCEPVREHALRRFGDETHFGYVEEEALRFFLANIGVLEKPIERIRIRPHPSEAAGKYGWVREEFDLPIEAGRRRPLVEEIADCDVVVGCESMAMVVGLLASKRVVSCIPPGGKACGLPQSEIEHCRRLITIRNRENFGSAPVKADR